ncbi:small ribosomal subunit Rsm22 family protein [Halobellus limi]|uniref:Methyltransferase domain-containing protein n=1 Tax=Halobellus limi TaxID=699433 RepID=A0A1H5ZCX6_9EURY|nr:methyltransferase [Halobellus limi]QCC48155.1 methyltransferase domain-containing protein [Halobellus limi]SEG33585.1 small ribosomal subunit Rsm22 [Halobellus limi]
MIDRDAVRSNAKYLRNVRPVDPEEIHEYVEGTPHPAVVRETLREEAYDLRLREREDGTFVPVSDDPAPRPGWTPDTFPDTYAFAVEDLLVERYGANWHRGESGDRLRGVIRRLKEDYYRGNPVEYDETAALGYAIYHLPDYYAAIGYVLDDLAERDRLPRTLRVLDVGAGAGGPALGLHDYLPEDAVVDYHAVEPSAAADVLDRVLGETGRNFRTTIHRETAEGFDPESVADGEGIDLVVFANVLSELDDPEAVAARYLDAVADDGSFLALAPADRNTSIGLREVERALAPADSAVSVYAPTLRLWPGEAPSDRGWSFDRRSDIEAPAFQRRLDEAGEADDPDGETDESGRTPGDGTFRNETVQFSYFVLRPDGARRTDVRADPDRHAKMAETERHVTNRIDLLAVKLSRDLTDGDDANPLFKIGDGSEAVEHYAVSTVRDSLNEALLLADYGEVVAFENVLCLWNDDEGAYNLVVDGETLVERVA